MQHCHQIGSTNWAASHRHQAFPLLSTGGTRIAILHTPSAGFLSLYPLSLITVFHIAVLL